MSKDKLPDSIDGHTRESIQEFYEIILTDKQWQLMYDFVKDPDREYETTESLIFDFVEKIAYLEWASDEYDKLLVKFHGQEEADRINGN